MRCHEALLRPAFALRDQGETMHTIASFRRAGRATSVWIVPCL